MYFRNNKNNDSHIYYLFDYFIIIIFRPDLLRISKLMLWARPLIGQPQFDLPICEVKIGIMETIFLMELTPFYPR